MDVPDRGPRIRRRRLPVGLLHSDGVGDGIGSARDASIGAKVCMSIAASRIPVPDPRTIEAWRDAEVEAYFRESHRESTPAPYKLMLLATSPATLKGWCRFWWATFRRGLVDHVLMERVRFRIASLVSCGF